MDDKRYVFENIEVALTGRAAVRALPSGKREEIVEFTPVDTVVGSWKKWAALRALYEILPSAPELPRRVSTLVPPIPPGRKIPPETNRGWRGGVGGDEC